ncbi:hypothetical protein [Cypionkella sp.]|uniref:hypothetical protein n=1 Tax=Cypionkella sp. TaxID=2811411 RepID=UPI00272581A5|nr:hypothetical protein [Cypionkella sp.]MDO8983002.1 hypothetical protein [Cypionkella sp.]
MWTETVDALPIKPGKSSYEQICCLIYVNGAYEVAVWNCEHDCWDDAEGDDFRYHPKQPRCWMPLDAPPPTPQETP